MKIAILLVVSEGYYDSERNIKTVCQISQKVKLKVTSSIYIF